MPEDISGLTLNRRKRYFIDTEIQLPLTLGLIFIATVEGVFVGWGLSRIIYLASDWQNARQILEFFAFLVITFLPMVAVNFWLSAWFTHRMIGPLSRARKALSSIVEGNLECEIVPREGDFLRHYLEDVNAAVRTLKRLIYRDHQYVQETVELLNQCRDKIENSGLSSEAKSDIQKLISQAKSRLSIVNVHFVRHRGDKT
jgi:methyl-accepting chemotaxis protein